MSERIAMIVALVTVSIIMLGLSIIAWRKKSAGSPAIFLSLCMAGVAVYSFGYGMELASDMLRFAMFWVRFQHWGIQVIAPTWLLFTLGVSGNKERITPALMIALSIIPLYLFFTSQTLGWLNLAHHNPRMDTSGGFPIFTYDRNLFNYLAIGYYSLCLAISTILFATMLLRVAPSFKKQAVVYLIGSLPPWVGAVVHNLNLSDSNLDFSPLALGFGGIILAYGFFRFRILDILPLARDVIFENMDNGVLLLDTEDRVIDFNPSLHKIFPEIKPQSIGLPVGIVLSEHTQVLNLIKEDCLQKIEFMAQRGESPAYYRVGLTPIVGRNQRPGGKIIHFYEYTQQRKLMDKLEQMAALDGLTGVYSRQHFDQLARNEISRLQRYGGVLSLMMFDLDNFKQINDSLGHEAGDLALVTLSENIRNILRESDLIARFGGDEFLILLPNTEVSAGCLLAERLIQYLHELVIEYAGYRFNLQASFGVTGITSDDSVTLGELYHFADRAMYRAKHSGGNAVRVFLPSEI